MLKFQVLDQGQPAAQLALRNAYLIGRDANAIQAEIAFKQGFVVCRKRDNDVAALALQQVAGDCGELTLQTCLLPERDKPYLLSLELARHRIMMLYNKLEDWGMFDLADDHPVIKRAELSRKLFVEALCLSETEPGKADRLAHDALSTAIDGTEELTLAHAELLLNKRKQSQSLPRFPIGCNVAPSVTHEHLKAAVRSNFDFLGLPMPWKKIAPEEGKYDWRLLDEWTEWARANRMPLMGGPVISFDPAHLPKWLFAWEDDYTTIRDLSYEHLERVVTRYRTAVGAWKVVSGLHLNRTFRFNFEQIIELTRMSVLLVRKLQPHARIWVEIREPFGEYYASNQRSIPPLMYGDLLVQGGVNFDGFAVKLLMGQAQSGQYARDLMQISNLLDQFAGYGKPVHLCVGVPSEPVAEHMIAVNNTVEQVDPHCGYWRKNWSSLVQSHWLEAVYNIAFSRPYIESVCWQDVVDHPDADLPLAGLVTEDLQPKSSYKRVVAFRRLLLGKDSPSSSLPPGRAAQASR